MGVSPRPAGKRKRPAPQPPPSETGQLLLPFAAQLITHRLPKPPRPKAKPRIDEDDLSEKERQEFHRLFWHFEDLEAPQIEEFFRRILRHRKAARARRDDYEIGRLVRQGGVESGGLRSSGTTRGTDDGDILKQLARAHPSIYPSLQPDARRPRRSEAEIGKQVRLGGVRSGAARRRKGQPARRRLQGRVDKLIAQHGGSLFWACGVLAERDLKRQGLRPPEDLRAAESQWEKVSALQRRYYATLTRKLKRD